MKSTMTQRTRTDYTKVKSRYMKTRLRGEFGSPKLSQKRQMTGNASAKMRDSVEPNTSVTLRDKSPSLSRKRTRFASA
jgi:hypothetical protein